MATLRPHPSLLLIFLVLASLLLVHSKPLVQENEGKQRLKRDNPEEDSPPESSAEEQEKEEDKPTEDNQNDSDAKEDEKDQPDEKKERDESPVEQTTEEKSNEVADEEPERQKDPKQKGSKRWFQPVRGWGYPALSAFHGLGFGLGGFYPSAAPGLVPAHGGGAGNGLGYGFGLGWPGYWYKSKIPKGTRSPQGQSFKKFGVQHPWGYGLGYYPGFAGPWGGYYAAPYSYGLASFPSYGFFSNPAFYGTALFRSGVPKSNKKNANRRGEVAKRIYGYGGYAPFAVPAGFGYPGWANYGHPGLGIGVPAFGSFTPYLTHYPYGGCFYKSKIAKGKRNRREAPGKAEKKGFGGCGSFGGRGYGLIGGCGYGGFPGCWGGYGLGFPGFGQGGWGWGGPNYFPRGWGYGGFGGWLPAPPGCGQCCGFYKSKIAVDKKAKQSKKNPKREADEGKPAENAETDAKDDKKDKGDCGCKPPSSDNAENNQPSKRCCYGCGSGCGSGCLGLPFYGGFGYGGLGGYGLAGYGYGSYPFVGGLGYGLCGSPCADTLQVRYHTKHHQLLLKCC